MKYTKVTKTGDNSIEEIVEGDYEEVLTFYTEMENCTKDPQGLYNDEEENF